MRVKLDSWTDSHYMYVSHCYGLTCASYGTVRPRWKQRALTDHRKRRNAARVTPFVVVCELLGLDGADETGSVDVGGVTQHEEGFVPLLRVL